MNVDAIVGKICATLIGIALLVVDGQLAIGYCVAIGGTLAGIEIKTYRDKKLIPSKPYQ